MSEHQNGAGNVTGNPIKPKGDHNLPGYVRPKRFQGKRGVEGQSSVMAHKRLPAAPSERAQVRELARLYTPTAFESLAKIAEYGKNEAARVSACSVLLDRAWGRPAVAHEVDAQPSTAITVLFDGKPAHALIHEVSDLNDDDSHDPD